jgi:hypothetical protein
MPPAGPPVPGAKNAKLVTTVIPTLRPYVYPRPQPSAAAQGTDQPALIRLSEKFVSGNGLGRDPGRRARPAPSPGQTLRWMTRLQRSFRLKIQFRARLPAFDPTAVCFLFDTAFQWNPKLAACFQQSHHAASASAARIPGECLNTIRNARPVTCQGVSLSPVVSFQSSDPCEPARCNRNWSRTGK